MRRRVLDFACWLFGHEAILPVFASDAMRCECGRRQYTMALWAHLERERRKRRWRL